MEDSMLNRPVCHCGAVVMRVAEKLSEIFECNCSICRRLGVLWAYYHCDDVEFEKGAGTTNVYAWNRKVLEFHSCSVCGCTTHWVATDPNFRDRMGVNARLIDGLNRTNTVIGYVDHGEIGCFWTRDSNAQQGGAR